MFGIVARESTDSNRSVNADRLDVDSTDEGFGDGQIEKHRGRLSWLLHRAAERNKGVGGLERWRERERERFLEKGQK